MTTTLVAAAAHLPPSVPIRTLSAALGLSTVDVRVYEKYYGLHSVRVAPDRQLRDLLLAAVRQLEPLPRLAHRVRYVIHARTVHPTGPYSTNPLAETVRSLGLDRPVGFAVTQHACASGLLALDLAGRLLAGTGEPDALALVLAGEKTYPHVDRMMPVPTVMGEATAACLVGHGGTGDQVLGYATRTHGAYHAGPAMAPELRAEFQRMYPAALADVMRDAAGQAGLDLHQVDLVLPHNVNRISWVGFTRLTGFPVERVFLDNVPLTGHCFCADPLVNYVCARDRGLLRAGDHYLLASVGLGATFSATLLRRGEEG